MAVGFGVVGFGTVELLAARFSNDTFPAAPEQAMLAYAPPERCSGARVVSQFRAGPPDTATTRPGSAGLPVPVAEHRLDRALYETVHGADFNEDGTIGTAGLLLAGVAATRPAAGWPPGGAPPWAMVYAPSPAETGGYVAVHRGRGCWTSGLGTQP